MTIAPNSKNRGRLSNRYPSEYPSVALVRHAVADFALECGFDLADVCDIALAVGEACNNAVEHGHIASGSIHLTCAYDGLDLRIAVSDQGTGFDTRDLGEAISPHTRGERGLGIFLMRTLMDRVEYESGSDGTRVRLTKRNRR